MAKKPEGWQNKRPDDPQRHAAAARGVKTGSKKQKFHIDFYVDTEGYERYGGIVEARNEAEARDIVMRFLDEQWPLPKGMTEEPEMFDSSSESWFERVKKEDIEVGKKKVDG